MRPAYEEAQREWKSRGMSAPLGSQLAALPYLNACPDIIDLARQRKRDPVEVAKVYFRIAEALKLPWLLEQIDALHVEGRWHAIARGVLRDELAVQHRALVAQVLSMPGGDAATKVQQWMDRDDPTLRFTLDMLEELATKKTLDYPIASVAVRRLEQLTTSQD
jgi:glutamate dehydrogenase